MFRLALASLVLAVAGCAYSPRPSRVSAADLIQIEPSSEWAEFGDYMRGLVAVVEKRWFAILDQSRVAPRTGTHVTVTFTLDVDGKVSVLQTEGDAGQQGTYACTGALTMDSVGGKWTDAMIAKLGRQQKLTFTFYYQ